MGLNLISGCHKCKEKVFHFRGDENETLMPFYKAHIDCIKENRNNVVTLEIQHQWEDWMDGNSGYQDFYLSGDGK